ncbi:hypothetical protein ACS0PU_012998 [Formica fusca]
MASALVKTISDYRSRALPSAANHQESGEDPERGSSSASESPPRVHRRIVKEGSENTFLPVFGLKAVTTKRTGTR